jgi:hypothetical protein
LAAELVVVFLAWLDLWRQVTKALLLLLFANKSARMETTFETKKGRMWLYHRRCSAQRENNYERLVMAIHWFVPLPYLRTK